MKKVKHRFFNNPLNPNTETLIIGTFNPEIIDNPASFFYGRNRNYLWRLLPIAYQESDLKNAEVPKKIEFIQRRKIDFIDLISEIEVDEGQESNYYDGYLDGKVISWRNVILEIDQLKNLKRVCFTRKTFSDIPNISKRIDTIHSHCESKNIYFKAITTPARFYSNDKQDEWTNFLRRKLD